MPNHVDNHLIITAAPAVLDDVRAFFKDGFDFNKLIPMPPELDIPDGSSGEIGYQVLYGDWQAVAGYKWTPEASSREELIAWFEQEKPEVLMLGRQYRENEHRHGARTWYDWRITHWGTKWNAYEFQLVNEETPFEVAFMSAWDAPHPVIEAFSTRFPEATVRHVYVDEGALVSEVRCYERGELVSLVGTGGVLDFARCLARRERDQASA